MARNEPYIEKPDEIKKEFDKMLKANGVDLEDKSLYDAALNMFKLGWQAHERMWYIRYCDDGK